MKIVVKKVDFLNQRRALVTFEVIGPEFSCKGETEIDIDKENLIDEHSIYEMIAKDAIETYKFQKRIHKLQHILKNLEGKEIPPEWILDGELKT